MLPVADVAGSEYTHRYIIWISPRVVPWIAPVALVLVFLLLFFPWRSVPADATSEIGSLSGWGKLFSGPLLMFYFLLYLVALALKRRQPVGYTQISSPCPTALSYYAPHALSQFIPVLSIRLRMGI